MTNRDTVDDTSDDRDRFEAELLARDRDATSSSTADIGQYAARRLVNDLVESGLAFPVPEERLLVHDPSGEAFESITQLAVFHRGWTAASECTEDD